MGVCFVEPARHDIIRHGKKIAGAAQRRSKAGLLHQGSAQIGVPPADFAAEFAQGLAVGITLEDHAQTEARLHENALRLQEEKYGYPSWLSARKTVGQE